MSCGMCGGGKTNPRRYKVTLKDGEEHVFLTETEGRIFATQNGGGRIEHVNDDT